MGEELGRRLIRRWGARRSLKKLEFELFSASWEGEEVGVALPRVYVNLSGLAVRALREALSLELPHILVACDDANLPLGKIRLRPKGSDGGHKGLRSIIDVLGTQDFPRLRMGIGRPPEGCDMVEFVLSPFSADERPVVEEMLERACEAVEEWVRSGIEKAMSKFNA